MDREQLASEVASIRWWHTIDLGNGIVTPGVDDSRAKLDFVRMPADLSGRSVLDVGAWDGFFSFEAERRGARRVLATDSFSWGEGGWGSKQGFELARRALGSRVEDRDIDVLDLSPEAVGVFDEVLFLGILYHMRNPLLALEKVASVTGQRLILETHIELAQSKKPVMVFFPAQELADDATNWWGPNPAAVEAMLRAVGFRRVERVASQLRRSSLPARLAHGTYNMLTKGWSLFETQGYGRMAFHAWK